MDDRYNAIRRMNPLEDPGWDARLGDCPGATFFHGAAWARVLYSSYGFRPVYFVSDHPNGRRSVLPLMEVDSWVTGRRGVSLPFTDECEPLSEDEREFARLLQAALSYGESRRWRHWEVRGGRSVLPTARASVSFHGHKLALPRDPSRLFSVFDSSVRRAVRKAEQSDLVVEFSQSAEAVRAFHGLLCKTRRRLGVPPQPIGFFESIQKHILAADQGCVVLARSGGVPVAGAVFFHFGKSVLYKYGASDEAFQHLRPNNLVMWRAIESFARAGFESLDFGRTSLDNEGLRRFKLGWGASERAIEYFRYQRRSKSFVSGKDRSSGWQNELFKVLPSFASRLIGAAAYKHVA